MPEPATQISEQQEFNIETPEIPPEPPPPTPPTLEDQLRAEREEKARLQGLLQAREDELRRARETPPTKTAQPPEPQKLTPQTIEEAYTKGQITDEEKSRLYARYEAEEVLRKQQERDREENVYREAEKGLSDLMEKHPDLNNGQSALIQEVRTELVEMARLGYDPKDVRTQYIAAKAVVGRIGTVPSMKEHERLRIPVGGGGGDFGGEPPGGSGKPKMSRGQQIYERLTDEAKAFYRDYHGGNMAAIYKTLDHSDEGILKRSGRFKS